MIGGFGRAVAGATFPATALQQAHVSPADSVRVESPLPGGVSEVVRFLLNSVPSWLQLTGIAVGALVGALLLVLLLRRRHAIREWLTTRNRGAKVALGAVALVLLVAAGSFGMAAWNYTQHSNEFCTGCHVMNPAFQRFSDAENRHAELSCHDCHQQPMSASIRQLYLWVAERPEEIGEHAKVPNHVCATCHVTGDTATWRRIASTAGHRVHLESDSSTLKDLQCVSCHGVEVHRFNPVNATCGQSGCHSSTETNIVLGKMALQTVHHCTSCHEFTADVPALAGRDSARGTLVPGRTQCLGCHAMQLVLPDFDASRDPHGGKCGACHNPHVQETPAAAAATCATAGCHANWRDEPFHVGESHRRVGSRCLDCHVPHQAKVDASNCVGCHQAVRQRSALRPPMPFDTSSALRRTGVVDTGTSHPPTPASSTTGHSVLRAMQPPGPPEPEEYQHPLVFELEDGGTPGPTVEIGHLSTVPREPPAPADTFPHDRHTRFACLECHQTGGGHGRLTFEPPRGCAICHHQAPTPQGCATCHRTAEYSTPKPATLTVTVPGQPPRPRPVDFLHERHVSRPCTECHTTAVTLAPPPSKAQCRDCHVEHHDAGRTCSACHTLARPAAAHNTLEIAHQRCDACHTATTIARLTPTRSFCSTCHAPMARNHYDRRECTVCHFLAEPGVHRARLTTPPPG